MTAITRHLSVVSDSDNAPLLKVAFATSDGICVDQHFGSASAFAIYGVNPDVVELSSIAEFGTLRQDGNEDKLVHKLRLLEGCIAVYCRACGASAVRQLLELGVQPIKVADDSDIPHLLKALQTELRQGPSSWLAKAIQKQREAVNGKDRFDAMAGEVWDE